MNTINDDPGQTLTSRIFHVLCCMTNVDTSKFGQCCAGCTERVVSMHNIAKSVASEIQQVMRETVHDGRSR